MSDHLLICLVSPNVLFPPMILAIFSFDRTQIDSFQFALIENFLPESSQFLDRILNNVFADLINFGLQLFSEEGVDFHITSLLLVYPISLRWTELKIIKMSDFTLRNIF